MMKSQTKKTRSGTVKPAKIEPPLLVVAGEHSGDALGADLVRALQKKGIANFTGTGGDLMKSVGVELIEHADAMTVIGIVEAFRAYRRLKKLALRIVAICKEKGIRHAVLIDYPGFNLRLAKMLKENNITVIYLVSPQIWAWHYSRIRAIRSSVDLMLTLFAFEKEMYDREGVLAEWVGHTIVHSLPSRLKDEKPLSQISGSPVVALMPGSRKGEIRRLLPVMLKSARLIRKSYPNVQFLLPSINPECTEYIRHELAKAGDLNVEYCENQSLHVMESSDLLIIASGTATMEGACFKKPMVIVYRVGWMNFFLASMLMRTRYIGMPNLLARKPVALELLQIEVSPNFIFNEVDKILSDQNYRESIIEEMEYVKSKLGKGNPAEKAARAILLHIQR